MKLYQYKQKLILQIENGWGEISPLPGFSRETFEEAKKEILSVLQTGATPRLPSVQFGLSCAKKPFPSAPIKIPLCALNEPKPGSTTLKLKVGHLPLSKAIDLVKSYLGRYRLRIDCNRSWSLDQALTFASHFSPTDFEYLEEPLQTFSDLIAFSHRTQFPIAADESLRDSPYQQIPTLKAAIVKPTLMGSIPQLSIPTVLSSSYESSLGILHIAHQANPAIAQGLDTFQDDLLTSPLRRENGFLTWTPTPDFPIRTTNLREIWTAH